MSHGAESAAACLRRDIAEILEQERNEAPGADQDFLERLHTLSILDAACGSGNFLYIALQQLLNLEKELIAFGALPHIGMPLLPRVRPTQLHGIELNAYAARLPGMAAAIAAVVPPMPKPISRTTGALRPNVAAVSSGVFW